MKKALFFLPLIFMNIALAIGAEALGNMEVQIAVTGPDAKAIITSNPVEESIPAKAAIPAQNSFRGITVSIKAKKSVYEPGSFFEIVIVGTISTDREHTMYNAYWDLKKPVPGRLFVYDQAGNQILEFYDPRHHIGSSTGATKSACRKYKPGETQQIFLRQYLLFDRSADCPLPPGRYKVQLALNGLLLWEPQQYVAHDELPQGLDQQMVAYSNVVDIEIRGKPAFQGKTLTQWIEALKHGSPKVRYSAAWTLREMKDPRAVAPLIEALKDEYHKVRYRAIDALAAIGKPAVDSLIVALKEKDTQVRICAARALEQIADKRSVAPLIVALKEDQNRDVRSSAARALGNIKDKNAVPVLIEALRDKDIYPQVTVCSALRKIGKPAIDGLIVHLKDTDDQARIRVAKALAEIADKRSVEALVGALRDENPEVRNLAAHGLGRIKDQSAVPALIEALKADEVPQVRSSAARALGQTKGPGAVAALTAALKDKDVSTSARLALAEIGKPAVEHLIIALKDTDLHVRLSAAGALASIVDKKSLEPLIYALRDENDEVRALAARTLGKLEDKRAVMPLTACLNDKDVGVRKEVILALGKIKDGRAVEPIIAILQDKNQHIRSCAARGLGMIRDKRAVEPLIPLLKDTKDSGAAYYTAWALGEIGDKRAVEPLITCLNHELQHSPLLGKAAEALGKIKDERAVEPLMTALKVTRPRIPIPRHSDSSRTKPGDEAYLSLLIRILEDDYKARQYAVAWALVEIGQPAIGPLTHALQSDDKWLSGAAAVILEKIQASSATEPSTPMQSRQGKVEKQLAWLASEADLVVVAIKEQQIDNRFEIKQILKGSGHVTFEQFEKIDGMDMPPADETKQWIMFLRVEREHGRRLYPFVPTGWFVPYSKGLAQKIVEAIPSPNRWGPAEGGLRMGLRLRKTHVALGEDIPVEIHIQNVSQKNITLYQHLMPMYGYHPYTNFEVVSPDGKRWKLVKPVSAMGESEIIPALQLSPGQSYIHTTRLNKWAVEREPLKPGEKFNLFRPGTYKITCTYSVEPKPDYIHPWNPPKNAWSGTLTSSAIKFKIVPAEDTPHDTQPATKSVLRETIEDFQIDGRRRKVSWTLRVVTMEDYESKWFLRRPDHEKEEYIGSNIAELSEVHDIKASPNGRYLAVLSVGEGHPVLEVVDLPLFLKQKEYRVLRTINAYPGAVGINRWDKDRLIIDSDALLTHLSENGRVHHSLAEMPLQSYALSIESPKVEALSQDAKNPIAYFSRQLSVKYAGERDNAAMALVALKAKSAIPALKKALAAETNPAVRAGMQKAVDELGKLHRQAHLPGQMIDLAYIYTDCPSLREHKIIKGQQVIWLVHSPKDTSFFTGRKALPNTPQNRNVVQKAATEMEQAARWKTYLLAESGHIKVKLLIKENASPSDVEWMRLDFENTGSRQVRVTDARYDINRETFDLATGKPVSSGGLASGKTYDLFHDAWKTTPISPIFLAPGMYSVTDHPSSYSMALLGVPDKGGWRVEGTVRLSVQLANGNVLSTPEDGVKISFNWLYPDEAGFEAMRKRLRDLLLKPDNYIQHAFAIGALLSSPEVTKSLTVEELLDGIARREGAFDGRDELVKLVNQNFVYDPKVIDFYRAALEQNNWAAVSDLSRVATDIWDVSFVEPLVKMNKRSKGINPNQKNVLTVLSKHYSHWKNDHTVARHLSTALVKNYPELKTEPNDQNESRLIRWVNAVELLGMTRDKDMVSLLRPFLGCKVTVRTYKDDALLPRGVVPVPERACDTAYNAIMTLLEQENQKLELRPGLLGRWQVCKDPDGVREVLRKRDELIRALEVKLTDITLERGPALPTARPTTQPVETDISKKDFRIELYDKDAIKSGLLPIGLYDASEYPGAKWIYVQATKGQIPRGYNQLVGRMGGHYSHNDEIEVTEYKREGNRITAHIRYIRAKPEGNYDKVVYLLADIPQNLPPGRYNVVITLAEYLREGDKIIFAPKTAIRAFEQLTCTFEVPATYSALPAKDGTEVFNHGYPPAP